MATSKRHLCDICMTQHLTENAVVHCPECEESFCEKCKIHHEVAKATKKHEIISIENVLKLPKFVQDIKMNCSEHDERFVLYCEAHEVPCCTQCLHNGHAGCRNLTSFQKVIHNVKESPLLLDLVTTLSNLMTNIKNSIEDRTANLQGLAEQKKRCKKEIKTARGEIKAYFDDLETNLLDDLQKAFSEKKLEVQNMLEEFEVRKSDVCEMQEHVTIVKSIASEFQSFMAIRELIKTANTAEAELQHLFESGLSNWIEIFYAPIDWNSVKDKLPSIGNYYVRDDVSRIKLKVRKTLGAQLIGPAKSSGNIDSVQLKEKVKSKLPRGKYEFEVLDCGFLLDGNLVFSDKKSDRLVILDPNGLFVRSLCLCFHPIRFAVIDEEKIAITTTDQVNIVDLNKGFTFENISSRYKGKVNSINR